MGLFSNKNQTAATTGTGTHGHRYATRSHGPLGSTPGTTAGTATNVNNMDNSTLGGRHSAPNTGPLGSTTGRNTRAFGGTTGRTNVSNDSAATSTAPPLLPPNTYANSDPTVGHGSAKVTGGKIQNALGKAVGSGSLQMKGAQKIQQGEAEQVAAGHLREADRLENEAVMRREMAGAGHGVHTTAGNMRGGLRH